jgi:hypothetical protein
MRVFLLLLLANTIAIVAILSGWEWRPSPGLLAQPGLNEEKMRLIEEPQPETPAPKPQSANGPVEANRSRANLHLAMSISSPAATPSNVLVCLEWGEFSGADLKKVGAALATMNLGSKLEKQEADERRRYWVYMPPLPSKAAINRKISQLKARGINDYFVIQKPGDWHNAISLGVFKSREAADGFLAELQANRDIHTAKVGERAEKLPATTFSLKNVDAGVVAKIGEMQKEFSDAELKNMPCTH